jgi:hypothetical protein
MQAIASPETVLKRIGIGAMVLVPLLIACRVGYDSFVDRAIHFNIISGMGMWGTFVVHMATRPGRKEIGATLALGLGVRLLYAGATGWIAAGTYLGLASVMVLLFQAIQVNTARRALILRTLGVIAAFNYLGFCAIFLLSFTKLALPHKLDYFLYAFDGSLGFEPSFVAGKLVRAVPALDWLTAMVYNGLGLWFCIVYAAHTRAHGKYRINILVLLIADVFVGVALYFVFPAAGPRYAFPAFPNLPPAVRAGAVRFEGIPNAMPSLHMAGTLMVFWLSRPWPRLRIFTGGICAVTALATMSMGEHYLVDLVVAVPYSLAIFALAANTPDRRFPLAVGAGMVLVWLAVLRYGNLHAAVSWGLVIVTLAICWKVQRRFAGRVWDLAEAGGEPA